MEDQLIEEYFTAIQTLNRLAPLLAAHGYDTNLSINATSNVTGETFTKPVPIYYLGSLPKNTMAKPKQPELTANDFDAWQINQGKQPKRVYRTIDGNN